MLNVALPRISCSAITLATITLLASLSTGGCVTEEPVSKINPVLRQASVVSTSNPEFQPKPGGRLAKRLPLGQAQDDL